MAHYVNLDIVDQGKAEAYREGFKDGVEITGRKTGHWVVKEEYPNKVVCSNCTITYFLSCDVPLWKNGVIPRQYCPHCGAYMEDD